MAKVVDPPEGWRYGFPKVCDEEFSTAEEFNDWLVENGYPRSLIESYGKHFHLRMWEEKVKQFDRFDFEQQIMSCWNVTSDIKDLNEALFESDLTKDQISNILTGIEQLYQIRFDKLFRQFENLVKEHHESFDQ